jgi:hypothetical protein
VRIYAPQLLDLLLRSLELCYQPLVVVPCLGMLQTISVVLLLRHLQCLCLPLELSEDLAQAVATSAR